MNFSVSRRQPRKSSPFYFQSFSFTSWRRRRASSYCRQIVLIMGTMTQVDWYIEGAEFSNCNCDYACPCQFESRRPTHGDCRGFAAVCIDKGHFGGSMASAQPSSTPGRDQSTRGTASARPSSMTGRTASKETLLLPSCTWRDQRGGNTLVGL